MSAMRWLVLMITTVFVGGCGLFTPEMQAFWETRDQEKAFENIIVNNVKCEIRNGVYEAERLLASSTPYPGNDISWLEQQGALVTLKLVVDEKSSLNPGISYSDTAPRPFSLGVGTANSADATRTETVAFTYSFHDLMHEKGVEKYLGVPCDNENGVLIQSDLKIKDFIVNKVFLAKVPGSVVIEDVRGRKRTVANNPFSTFQYDQTFVISYGVNGTPTWKFTRVTVNPSSPLFSTSQQRTQDLTISISKTAPATKNAPAQPSAEAIALHNAALIGQAVATAIQSQSH